MEKVVLNDELWQVVRHAAVCFTGDVSLIGRIGSDDQPVIPRSLLQVHAILREARERRLKRIRGYEDQIELWAFNQEMAIDLIEGLHQKGIILDIAKTYRHLSDWNKGCFYGYAQPTEAAPMSDDVLDRSVQYLHINRNLLDDPEQFTDEYKI